MFISNDAVSAVRLQQPTTLQSQSSWRLSPQQQLLRRTLHGRKLRLSTADLMACAELGTPLEINETSVQISYSQQAARVREGLDDNGADHPNYPSDTRGSAQPYVVSNSKETIHKWMNLSDYQTNALKHHTSKFNTISEAAHTRERKLSLEHTYNGTQAHENYTDNVTCWLHMLPSKWYDYVAIVGLKRRSPCVPGNVVTVRGMTLKYLHLTRRIPDSVTWSGCEGPQDPLGDFFGTAIYVGFQISRFDVPYHVTLELNAYHLSKLPKNHTRLDAYKFTKTLGWYPRSFMYSMITV